MYQKSSINYAYFVEDVSRKFTLRKNKCTTKALGVTDVEPVRYMGGAVRTNLRFDTKAVTPVKINYMFLRFNPRSSGPSSAEIQQRQAFSSSVRAASAWLKDLAAIPNILTDWKEQSNGSIKGVAKRGYTMRGWLVAVAYAFLADGQEIPSAYPHNQYTPAV